MGVRVQVQVQGLNFVPHPYLHLTTRTGDLRAETWDPRMKLQLCRDAVPTLPVKGGSGWRLAVGSGRETDGRVADASLPCFAAVHHASSSPVRRRCVAQNRKLELTSKTAAMIAKAMKPTNEKAASRTEVEIVCETVSSQRSSSAR